MLMTLKCSKLYRVGDKALVQRVKGSTEKQWMMDLDIWEVQQGQAEMYNNRG